MTTQTHTQGTEPRTNAGRSDSEAPRSLDNSRKEIKSDLSALKHDAGEAAAIVKDRVRDEVEHIKEHARSGGDKAGEYHDSFKKAVSEHPTAAVLITLGIGAMLGRVFSGR